MKGMVRSLTRYSKGKWELKITVDWEDTKGKHSENMAIGLQDHDMETLLYSLRAEALIRDYLPVEPTR
jgi:hypothetical protein